MVCGMIRRSEMQVLSVKFWRCSPISLFAQGARSLRFGCLSRTNERSDRGRTHQRTINTSAVQAAVSAHRCGRALAFCALSAPRARVESPGKHEDEGDYRTFESAHRAQTACAPAHQRARKQAPQSVAQWLLPFSCIVPPRSSRTRPS
jgi:hypothetical protein